MRNRRAKPANSPSCLAMSRSGQMPEVEAICPQQILSEQGAGGREEQSLGVPLEG